MVSPNTRLIATRPLENRLTESRRITDNGCWEWTRAVTEHGYGRMSYQDQVHRVHRLAAHLWHGLDLDDSTTKVCHHCDNPPCFNPEHLYLGTQKTNVRDMIDRGRNYPGPDRWTHCTRGHELTPDNTVGVKKPRCRTCNNEQQNRRRREKQAVQAITAALEVQG